VDGRFSAERLSFEGCLNIRLFINKLKKCTWGRHVEIDKELFKKLFPNLAKELGSEENKVVINSVRTGTEKAEKDALENFHHYSPSVVDFIRRCDTHEQAEEVIAYLEKRGEISREHAETLRKQLKKHGLRSFGSRKEENYYLSHGQM